MPMIGECDQRAGEDPAAQLAVAIDRARRLVDELERNAADLKTNPPQLSDGDLKAGSLATERAVMSARRLLESLLSAREIAADGGIERDE